MAPRNRIEIEEQRDFTGGLNLKEEIVNLQKNETFDLQNVDIDRRGGFSLRRGSRPFIAVATGLPLGGTPDSGYTYVDPTNVRHILACRGGHVRRWDGAAWQDVLVNVGSGRTQFAEMLNNLYILRPSGAQVHRWAGAGLSTLIPTTVGAYHNDLTAPTANTFPPCNTLAVHGEVMWAGGVNEAAGFQPNRLRWSHPGRPEDWREQDYIDIDADDENGQIRALVSFGSRLIVFKDHAVYAVHGAAPAGFSVVELTKEVGVPSAAAVTSTEQGIFFWDTDTGLWEYNGKEFKHTFEPLYSLIDDNKINTAFSNQTIVQWHNQRAWVNVPFSAAPYAGTFLTLVFDPSAGKDGAWTLHTVQPFGWWIHHGSAGGDLHLLGGRQGYVFEFDVEGFYYDTDISLFQDLPITAWYTTRWYDADVRAVKKRWKRPVFVMQGGAEQRTIVEVLTDYDPTKVSKTFELLTTLDATEGIWDADDWDDFLWAAETLLAGDKAVILRGSPLGSGVAKALRMKNTTAGQDWRVHGLTMKWISKRLRN